MGNQLFQAARKAVEKAGEVLSGKMNDDHNHQQNQYSQHDDNEQNQFSGQHAHADADTKAKAEGALMSAFANASPAEQKQLSELQNELKNM